MRSTALVEAARLLKAIRESDHPATADALQALAKMPASDLAHHLREEDARTATWLNVYNAAAQRHLGDARAAPARRHHAFRTPAILIAGTPLTLDAIEHGLLRRSRWKVGLGYLGNPLPGTFERRFRVHRLDPRIHFALNCAAASCPPIAMYLPQRLDDQLDLATRAYLSATVRRVDDMLVIPRIFLWFRGDFRHAGGVRRFLEAHGIHVGSARLRSAPWDWTPAPGAWMTPDEAAGPRPAGDEPIAPGDATQGTR